MEPCRIDGKCKTDKMDQPALRGVLSFKKRGTMTHGTGSCSVWHMCIWRVTSMEWARITSGSKYIAGSWHSSKSRALNLTPWITVHALPSPHAHKGLQTPVPTFKWETLCSVVLLCFTPQGQMKMSYWVKGQLEMESTSINTQQYSWLKMTIDWHYCLFCTK